MKLSIVVPSFNQATHLPYTLDSLVNQRGISTNELEILVIDGGSTDGSVEVLKRYAPKLNYLVSEPDRGQTHALQKGFEHATGDIFGWLCSDDLLEPDAARRVLDYFSSHPDRDFFYGDGLWIDTDGQVIRPKKEIPFNWFIWKYDHNYIPQPSAFWRRSLHEAAGGLDESWNLAMDSDLWERFARLSPPDHLPVVLSRMRIHPAAKTQRLREASIAEQRKIARRAGGYFDSGLQLVMRRAVAKSWRVGWKLATGCYR